MKYKLLNTILFVLLFFNGVFAQSHVLATKEQKQMIISSISEVAKNTSTLKCDFVQEKSISILSEVIISEGVMCFKKDNNLRWEYTKPYSYIFILADGKVIIQNQDRVDSFDTNSNKMFKFISEIMIGGVKGDLLNDEKNFTSEIFVGNNDVIIKLVPKVDELSDLMSVINLTVNKKDWLVNSIEMEETSGDNTLIRFTQKNVNATVPDSLFKIN